MSEKQMVSEMLKEIFGDSNVHVHVEDMTQKNTEKRREINVPERPQGYESIIPPEVFEATKHLAYAFDNLVQVYHKSLQDTLVEAKRDKTYGAVQFLIFDDEFNTVMDSIQSLVNIHSFSKQDIDEVAKEKDCTVEQLATMMMMNNIMDKLKFILNH